MKRKIHVHVCMIMYFYLGFDSVNSRSRESLSGATSINGIDCPASILYSCTYSTTDDEPCGDDLYVSCIRGKALHREIDVRKK